MGDYELRFFAMIEDGEDDLREEPVREGFFPSVEAAEDRLDNIGSRWVFYPNARILGPDGEVVREYLA